MEGVQGWKGKLTRGLTERLSLQTERAYQKQPTIFQNKKRVLLGETGKEKLPRYYKNIGLGFKTPKEVQDPPTDETRGLACGSRATALFSAWLPSGLLGIVVW